MEQKIVITQGIQHLINDDYKIATSIQNMINRHMNNDWGDVTPEDAKSNDEAVQTKGMILSSYKYDDTKVWIITDPGHEIITVLLPEEY